MRFVLCDLGSAICDRYNVRMLRLLREPRYLFGTLLVGVAVAVTISLGFWQLDRLAQRRAYNALLEERRSLPPVTLPAGVPADLERLNERLASAYGAFVSEPTFLLLNRSYSGEGGVRVVNPFRLDSGQYLWVDRGWVPQKERNSPPPPVTDTVRLQGYLHVLPDDGYPSRPDTSEPQHWLRLDPRAMTETLRREETGYAGADFLPYALVMTESVTEAWIPKAIGLRELDDGPHMSYAIQWFSFSFIFFAGWMAYLWRASRRER